MKTYLLKIAGIIATALIISGCGPILYTHANDGYYGYTNYDYGDGPSIYYYGHDNQGYQYQQTTVVSVNQPYVSFNDFYNQLSPYGAWVNIAPYGQVWVANVRNFQPYSTNGYWAYTTYGWTWVSHYSWGWAPFHYGRWGHDNRYGWYWVPGYVWGPAWVAWSSSSDMYGWAPLMPGMSYGVNLSINLFPSTYWTFMQGRYMGHTNIGSYYVNRSKNVTIIKNTTIINNYGTENNRRYSMGPSANDVQRYTGRSIQPMRVSSAPDSRSASISNNEMRVYRPAANPDATSTRTTNTPDNNNRTSAPQTRTQSNQSTNNGSATPQTRTTQPNQSTNNGSATPQTRTTQPNQSASQRTSESSDYRPSPAQPRVTNSAAPQTSRQIQNAEKDNTRTQQRSTTTSGRR